MLTLVFLTLGPLDLGQPCSLVAPYRPPPGLDHPPAFEVRPHVLRLWPLLRSPGPAQHRVQVPACTAFQLPHQAQTPIPQRERGSGPGPDQPLPRFRCPRAAASQSPSPCKGREDSKSMSGVPCLGSLCADRVPAVPGRPGPQFALIHLALCQLHVLALFPSHRSLRPPGLPPPVTSRRFLFDAGPFLLRSA